MGVSVGAPLDVARPAPEAARELEEMGFDYATTGEHVAFHGPVANGFIALAAAAGATSRIGLLSTVTLLPLYPAVLAAKLAAELARHSQGRFALGVGIGGEFPPEFDAVGATTHDRVARTDEALEVLRRLLREDEVTFDGRFTHFKGLTIAPRPAAPPEIWVGGRKGSAVERTARYGDVWFPHFFSPERVASSLEDVRVRAAAQGRDPSEITAAIHLWTTIDDNRYSAETAAAAALSATYGMDMSNAVDRYTLVGTPDNCTERLGEYHAVGVRRFILAPLHAEVARRATILEAIATTLLPSLKEM
jgi:alkanesulfonate monooxygenase SsuD/methylene tetrahydromethanopterin reductase-like flavin-dependent oxidoreductase (luciferase family)